jgi:hypothetical protein
MSLRLGKEVWRELGGMGGFAKRWRRRKEQGDREKELSGL